MLGLGLWARESLFYILTKAAPSGTDSKAFATCWQDGELNGVAALDPGSTSPQDRADASIIPSGAVPDVHCG